MRGWGSPSWHAGGAATDRATALAQWRLHDTDPDPRRSRLQVRHATSQVDAVHTSATDAGRTDKRIALVRQRSPARQWQATTRRLVPTRAIRRRSSRHAKTCSWRRAGRPRVARRGPAVLSRRVRGRGAELALRAEAAVPTRVTRSLSLSFCQLYPLASLGGSVDRAPSPLVGTESLSHSPSEGPRSCLDGMLGPPVSPVTASSSESPEAGRAAVSRTRDASVPA